MEVTSSGKRSNSINVPKPFDPFIFDRLDDICKNWHGGNENAVASLAAV